MNDHDPGCPGWRDARPVWRFPADIASRNRIRATTLIEVLTVIAVLMLLAALLLPALVRTRPPSRGLHCVNRLKQVGLSFLVWARDNGDRFPMQVSTNDGGTMEFVAGPYAFRHFQVMSNELNTPKILFCPNESDPSRTMANSFDTFPPGGVVGRVPFSGNSNLSYFVGVDAAELNPQALLAGDRNLTNGTPIRSGRLELTTNRLTGWTRELHVNQGNVCLADGSVQSLDTEALRQALVDSGVATNRLSMP